MQALKAIAFTHKHLDLEALGALHVEKEALGETLEPLKEKLGLQELFYLSTCNRVEFYFTLDGALDRQFLRDLLHHFAGITGRELVREDRFINSALLYEGSDAVEHIFRVASSMDSMVVGEREIISQVRDAYENCKKAGLTGDKIRLLTENAIKTAKAVYSSTGIGTRPVSVVSLAFKKLKDKNFPLDVRILLVGTGKTNRSMARFLKKCGFSDISLFNRTLENAESLAEEIGGRAYPLDQLGEKGKGAEILITCTGSKEAVIDKNTFQALWSNTGQDQRPVVVDLAVPGDLDQTLSERPDIELISVEDLRPEAEKNLQYRKNEVEHGRRIIREHLEAFRESYHTREVEQAMKEVPQKVKEIRKNAVESVFARDLEQMDEGSREVLEKVVAYLEKKYISMPMKMAKEILLEEGTGDDKKGITDRSK